MSADLKNMDWLRKLEIPGSTAAGARFYELMDSVRRHLDTLEQQTNSNLSGTPTAPPPPDSLTVVPHPQGVQFAINHQGDFYQGAHYEIDCTSGGVTHTYHVGNSRNGILPVGNLTATYQVRTRYAASNSSPAVLATQPVTGGSGTSALLPGQGAGTTLPGQPPGFGGPFRSVTGKPPVRNAK